MKLDTLEVITLFADDIAATKAFYAKVFGARSIFADDNSEVLDFGGVMINLLVSRQAPELVTPGKVAPEGLGARALYTIRVADVDATCRELQALGVELLNGPMDRSWGRRTAAFADPAGNAWEVAQLVG